MPESNGFGDYTESGKVILVSFLSRRGGYTRCMFLDDEGPIADSRELWGFPKKLGQPTLKEFDTLIGTLDYGTMGYKHLEADWCKSSPLSRSRTFFSRSFRTSMAVRGSASLSSITLSNLS
jgi:acetoacetate decarboxylase